MIMSVWMDFNFSTMAGGRKRSLPLELKYMTKSVVEFKTEANEGFACREIQSRLSASVSWRAASNTLILPLLSRTSRKLREKITAMGVMRIREKRLIILAVSKEW